MPTPTTGTAGGSAVSTWNLGDIAAGGEVVVTIDGSLNVTGFPTSSDGDVISNMASVVATGVSAVNVTETTNVIDPMFTFTVSKSVSPAGTVAAGTTLTYTMVVSVTGAGGPATGVVLTDTYDADFTFLTTDTTPSSGNNVWTLGSIATGASQTVVVTGTVSADPGTVVTNQVTATATNAPSTTDSVSNTIAGAPAPAPILEIIKDDDADPRQVGDTLVYTVRVENNGTATANNIVITETYPPFFTFVSAAESGVTPITPSGPSNNIFDDFLLLAGNDLLAGRDYFLTITGTVAAGASGSLLNNVSVTSDEGVPAATTETTTIGAAPPAVATLEVTKTDTPDPVQPGGALTYTVTVTNTGTAEATTVMVTETYPGEFTPASAMLDGAPIMAGPGNTFALGSIAPGDQAVLEIVGAVSNMAANGATLTNSVLVTSPDATDASTSENTTVSTSTTQLELTKADSVDPVVPGGTVIYSVRVENTGTQDATNVVVTETYPAEFTTASATLDGAPIMAGPGNTFDLGSIAPGVANAKTLLITGTVDAAALDGVVLNNSATATADNAPDATISETTTVTAPTLTVAKTDSVDPVSPGGALTYTVTVSNTGTADATNVVLTETYPAEFTFGSATPAPTTGNNVFSLGGLAVGASTVVTINGTVVASTPDTTVLSNAVTAAADNAPDATTTETTTVTAPVLTVTKTDSVDPVIPGGALTYTVTVSNTGTDAATNVVVAEAYPAEFTFGSATPAPTTGDNVFALGALAGGASTVVTINGTVDASTPDTTALSNAVTTSADNAPDATTTETTTVNRPSTETTVPTATGTGSVTLTLTGGGSTCAIGAVTTLTDAAVPEDGPAGVLFPHGLVKATYAACDPGSTITVKLTFPAIPPLPPGTQFWKYGPRPGIPAAWYVLPATIVGNMVTFQLTDGGLGDDDLTANGTIVDPGGPGTLPRVPVMPWWVLALLTLALMWSARVVLRRQGSM